MKKWITASYKFMKLTYCKYKTIKLNKPQQIFRPTAFNIKCAYVE